MNQTTWIVGGGALVLAVAVGLFLFTGNYENGKARSAKEAASVAANTQPTVENNTLAPTPAEMTAVIATSMGDITIRFYGNDAPKTVANFAKLAKEGFYDGVKFHRVIKGFMNQTGDPLSKDDTKMAAWGTGGPGYKFADEIDPAGALYQKGYKTGVVAMANSGPNTNGSQFFIMAADYPLPPSYTIFGEVTSGLDVVAAINDVKTGANDRPLQAVVVNSVRVE